MPRYERAYSGEYRTEQVTLKLTPSERAELEDGADGRKLSTYARELLFRRRAAVVAATRRNPEAAALLRELDAAAKELNAIGNNLNQIARHLNATGDLRDWRELRDAIAAFEQGSTRHLTALDRVLAL